MFMWVKVDLLQKEYLEMIQVLCKLHSSYALCTGCRQGHSKCMHMASVWIYDNSVVIVGDLKDDFHVDGIPAIISDGQIILY